MVTAVEDIVRVGDEQIEAIEHAIADLERQHSEIQAELASIMDAQEARAERLAALAQKQADVQALEFAHSAAASYAQLAQKAQASNAREAAQAATTTKKQWQSAQKALEQLRADSAQTDQVIAMHEQELRQQLDQLQAALDTKYAEKAAILPGRDKAIQELGELRYSELLPPYLEKQAQVEACRAQLREAEQDLQSYCNDAMAQLTPWLALQHAFANLQPANDATTRALEACLHYAQTFVQDGEQVDREFLQQHGWSFRPWDVLVIPESEITSYPGQLAERCERLERLLEEYRAYQVTKE